VAQVTAHAVAPQRYGAHGVLLPALQVPAPLHAGAAVWFPPEHDPAPHTVPESQSRQAPALHLPSVPQLDAAVTAQRPRGSGLPFVASAHVPFVPPVSALEHAWHAPVHAVLQQTPSTQNPLEHWFCPPHVAPSACFTTQIVPVHHSPLTHCASLEHDARQACAPQTYGVHAAVPPPWLQLPAPSHVFAAVCAPLAQVAAAHAVPAGYFRHAPVPMAQVPLVPHEAPP
jgi:hypothetical protein